MLNLEGGIMSKEQENNTHKITIEEIAMATENVSGSEVERVTRGVRDTILNRGENNIEQNPDLGDR